CSFFLILRPPPTSTLFPYTTLFRSEVRDGWVAALQHHFVSAIVPPRGAPYNFTLGVSGDEYLLSATGPEETLAPGATARFGQVRSEEHTSELQSRGHLVCRLLLEKK